MKKQTEKGTAAKAAGKANTKSRNEVIQDTGHRVSKARDESGQNPRGNLRENRDARDRDEGAGYADDTLAGTAKSKTPAKSGKGADTDKSYGSGRNTSPAAEWDEGGSRSRRGAPRALEGRELADDNYGDADERETGKLKGTAVKPTRRNEDSIRE